MKVEKSSNLALLNAATKIAWAMLICVPNLVHMHSDETFNYMCIMMQPIIR